jgi:hypothetical protein
LNGYGYDRIFLSGYGYDYDYGQKFLSSYGYGYGQNFLSGYGYDQKNWLRGNSKKVPSENGDQNTL